MPFIKTLRRALLVSALAVSVSACSAERSPTDMTPRLQQAVAQQAQGDVTVQFATSRAKFPEVDSRLIDAITIINASINRSITYVDDYTQYGVMEKWVWLPESGYGDCEEYAIAKLAVLQKAGFPVITHTKLVFLMTPRGGHAVLEVKLTNGRTAILDNNFMDLMTREELTRNHGYQFQDW